VKKCHSLIKVFSRSLKKLKIYIKSKKPQHKLMADVRGSTYVMVSRIVELQHAICSMLAEDRKHRSKMPSDGNFDMVKICNLCPI